MMLRLFLLFTLVPALELYLLIQLGQYMGALQTVLLIFVTGALGSFLAKREGLSVLRQIQQDAQRGIPPADQLVEGLLVLVGGVLLITPGVLTDLAGFALIAPWTRRALAPAIRQAVMKRFVVQSSFGGVNMEFGPLGTPHAEPPRREPTGGQGSSGSGGSFEHPVAE